jgi:hypothetical protein
MLLSKQRVFIPTQLKKRNRRHAMIRNVANQYFQGGRESKIMRLS